MSTFIAIIGIIMVAAFAVQMFSGGSRASVEDAHDKMLEAQINLDRVVKEQEAIASQKVTDAEENLRKSVVATNTAIAEDAAQSDYVELNVDRLISTSMLSFGEIIDQVKTNFHPVTRLLVIYMFVELLDESISDENSLIGPFTKQFTKTVLSEIDWAHNFYNNADDNEMFVAPVYWANVLQSRIKTSYESLQDDKMREQMCAEFTADLASSIEDDQLIEKFCVEVRQFTNKYGLYTSGVELSLAGIQL